MQSVTGSPNAGTLVQNTNYTAILSQLSVPLGQCHIKVLDLPPKHQQPADDKRLNYVVSAGEKTRELAKRYPVLHNDTFVSRAWFSPDNKSIAFLMFNPMGDFVLLSRDAGTNWIGPLYLGIHRLPEAWYATLADSKLPMISANKLELEVTIWKRDKTQAGSPLLGYKYLWKKWNKYLSMNLDDLQRDSDGDGLTDLFEERILTNPRSPDTDGDGLPDGSDNQPLTPFPKKITTSDAVMLSLIPRGITPLLYTLFPLSRLTQNFTSFDPFLSRESLTKEGVAYYTQPHSSFIPIYRTHVIIASGDSFPHITGNSRVIVFRKRDFMKYMERFPEETHLYANSFDLRYAPDKKAALLKVFEDNTGVTVILWKKHGQWLCAETERVLCD